MKEQEFKKEIERLICVFDAPKNYGPLMLRCYYEAISCIWQ
ncbi:MAG: hypothetical protein Q7U57_19555 [Methylovulum sp.]|nr:hypothetical protein [Methylovulum sp.]